MNILPEIELHWSLKTIHSALIGKQIIIKVYKSLNKGWKITLFY